MINQKTRTLEKIVKAVFLACLAIALFSITFEGTFLLRWLLRCLFIVVCGAGAVNLFLKKSSENNLDEREHAIRHEAGNIAKLIVMIAATGFIIYDAIQKGDPDPRFIFILAIAGITEGVYCKLRGIRG